MTINIPNKVLQYLESSDLEMVQLGATLLPNYVPKKHITRIMNMFCAEDNFTSSKNWGWMSKKWNWHQDSEGNILISALDTTYGSSTTTYTTGGYRASTTCVTVDSNGVLSLTQPATVTANTSATTVCNNGGPPSP